MRESEVIDRIKAICKSRSWSYYKLAKHSGIAYSTLSTVLNKTMAPSIPTLSKICDGFGITLAQFFSDNDETVFYTSEEKAHIELWNKLNSNGKELANAYITGLLDMQFSNEK